jgi:hypothetical protein
MVSHMGRLIVGTCISLMTVPSAAGAATVSLCGTSVEYASTPPAAGAPPDASDLPGVWVGDWDRMLCSALVVESVSAQGDVTAWYVYGRYPQWNISQPGKYHMTGKLSGKTIVFKGRSETDYSIVDAHTLNGTYSNSSGQYKGTFKKQ